MKTKPMQHYEIQAIFESTYKGQANFMTPKVITYGKKGRYIYEISEGRGIGTDKLFGVTVLSIDGARQPELSKCFRLQHQAISYAKNIR